MLPTQLNRIDADTLSGLCTDGCPESQTLEFKRLLPPVDENGRIEFSKDVCAFANADGGDLVFGIAEVDACASQLQALVGETIDAAKRRLVSVLDSRVEPRIPGLQLHEVRLPGGFALIVRVPSSLDGPHRYSTSSGQRFVARVGTQTLELTFMQLRTAFDRTASLAELVRTFRANRLTAIRDGHGSLPMRVGPKCVVHLIPLAAMSGRVVVDVAALYNNYQQFMHNDWGGGSRTLNLDGLVVHPGGRTDADARTYVQVFRSGAIESIRFAGRLVDEQRIMPSRTISSFVRETAGKLVSAAISFGIVGPAVLGVSILETDGYNFGIVDRMGLNVLQPSDRANLIIPESWIDRIEDNVSADSLARPILDILWQAFDVERCYDYDNFGRWIDR